MEPEEERKGKEQQHGVLSVTSLGNTQLRCNQPCEGSLSRQRIEFSGVVEQLFGETNALCLALRRVALKMSKMGSFFFNRSQHLSFYT